MIDTDKYENITPERWTVDEEDPCRVVDAQDCTIARTDFVSIDEEREWQLANAQLIADAPLLLEFIQKIVKEWNMPNKCNQEFGKDVRQLMYEYGLITFNEETRRYEVKKND